jgi:hypothetical protein
MISEKKRILDRAIDEVMGKWVPESLATRVRRIAMKKQIYDIIDQEEIEEVLETARKLKEQRSTRVDILRAAGLLVALTLVLGLATPAAAQITTYTPYPFTGGGVFNTPGQPSTTYTPYPFTGGGVFTTPGQPSTTYTPSPFTGGGTFYTPPQFQPLVRPYGR